MVRKWKLANAAMEQNLFKVELDKELDNDALTELANLPVGEDWVKIIQAEEARRAAAPPPDPDPESGAPLPDPPLGGAVEVSASEQEWGPKLYQVDDAWVVSAPGTGEMARLPQPSEGHIWKESVEQLEGGRSVAGLDEVDAQTGIRKRRMTMDEVLKMRLYRAAQPPEEDSRLLESHRGLMVHHTGNRSTAWRREQQQAKTARGVMWKPPPIPEFRNPPEMAFKSWIYQLSRAENANVMVEMVYLERLLFGHTETQWVKNNLEGLRDLLSFWDLSGKHYQRGSQGENRQRKDKGLEPLSEEEQSEYVPETVTSLLGAIVALVHQVKPVREDKKKAATTDGVDFKENGRQVQVVKSSLGY